MFPLPFCLAGVGFYSVLFLERVLFWSANASASANSSASTRDMIQPPQGMQQGGNFVQHVVEVDDLSEEVMRSLTKDESNQQEEPVKQEEEQQQQQRRFIIRLCVS